MLYRLLSLAPALMLGALFTSQAQAADVAVSVQIGQPGFYGRIDIGNAPQPELIYAEPVLIQRSPTRYAPLYLRVPPGHEKHWDKHCGRYNACGRPVYFVQDRWYNEVYAPDYRNRHGHGRDHDDDHDHGRGKDNGHGRGHDR